MARNSELDSLKTREQEVFRRKQLAYQKYADAKDRASAAYSIMQSAWEERCSAREEMNREYESMQHSSDNYREVWGEYSRIRDANNSRIESLRYEADSEHQMMKDCFEQASAAYEYGDKSEAPGYAAQGHEHKDRRNELNEEVGRLIQEIRNVKEAAECRAPKTDSSAFRRAKEVFSSAKSCHESAEAEFKRLKAERDRAKAEFNSAQEEFVHLRDEFQKRLAEVKAENQRERDKTLDEAGINWSERDDAKIVKKADGTVQVYHGGLGSGDGLGHGHTAIDQFGHKTYDRGAFEEHGHQNYTDDPTLSSYPAKGQWPDIRHGWIDDHKVTWSEGIGVNAGQTLIRSGWVDKAEFDAHHDHYGPDVKYGSGKRIEDVTDSLGRKKYYFGPGK